MLKELSTIEPSVSSLVGLIAECVTAFMNKSVVPGGLPAILRLSTGTPYFRSVCGSALGTFLTGVGAGTLNVSITLSSRNDGFGADCMLVAILDGWSNTWSDVGFLG